MHFDREIFRIKFGKIQKLKKIEKFSIFYREIFKRRKKQENDLGENNDEQSSGFSAQICISSIYAFFFDIFFFAIFFLYISD